LNGHLAFLVQTLWRKHQKLVKNQISTLIMTSHTKKTNPKLPVFFQFWTRRLFASSEGLKSLEQDNLIGWWVMVVQSDAGKVAQIASIMNISYTSTKCAKSNVSCVGLKTIYTATQYDCLDWIQWISTCWIKRLTSLPAKVFANSSYLFKLTISQTLLFLKLRFCMNTMHIPLFYKFKVCRITSNVLANLDD